MDPESETSTIEIHLLLEAIHARYGYDLRGYTSASMNRRILAALGKSGLSHLGELQHKILVDPDFFRNVLGDLTVRVSGMFRDPTFYQAFRTKVVPLLRTYPLLKIWHSGCASGEEVYTTAILLSEEGIYERAQIYATDLSLHALEQAKQGIYTNERIDEWGKNYLEAGGRSRFSDYYTSAYDRIAIRESLRRNVSFFHHDLVSDYVFGEMHVIFCRNVLIYFGYDLRERVLTHFAESLLPGGFLCLGSSERLAPSSVNGAFTAFVPEARIYRHEGMMGE